MKIELRRLVQGTLGDLLVLAVAVALVFAVFFLTSFLSHLGLLGEMQERFVLGAAFAFDVFAIYAAIAIILFRKESRAGRISVEVLLIALRQACSKIRGSRSVEKG